MTTGNLLALSVLAIGLMSCSPNDEGPWLRDDFAQVVDAISFDRHRPQNAKGPSQRIGPLPAIWRKGNLMLQAKHGVNGRLAAFTDEMPLVMVSFPSESPLGRQLAQSRHTIFWNEGADGSDGHALVQVAPGFDLTAVARDAHDRPEFGCGLLEYVSGAGLVDVDNYTGPEFVETVRIDTVADLIVEPSTAQISATIKSLEELGSRYHGEPTGASATAKVAELMAAAGDGISGFEVTQFDHSNTLLTKQKSVIARITGEAADLPIIVLGAHLDSINRADETAAPGADDDASGIATLVELLRVIRDKQLTFRRTIEIHGYAAEEVGLIGSTNIAQSYRAEGKKVAAMFQLDMDSWSTDPNDVTIHLVTNDTDPILRRSLKDLMTTYLDGKYLEGTLKAGTSDHRSWTNQGFHAVFPFEHPIDHNQSLHTQNDSLSTINNIPLAAQFVRLGLAFIAHHAGLIAAEPVYEKAVTETAQSKLADDIKVAVIATDWPDEWDIAVASTTGVEKVESCFVADTKTRQCSRGLAVLTAAGELSDRRFFIGDGKKTFTLADGDAVLFTGYDKADRAVQQRAVKLRRK